MGLTAIGGSADYTILKQAQGVSSSKAVSSTDAASTVSSTKAVSENGAVAVASGTSASAETDGAKGSSSQPARGVSVSANSSSSKYYDPADTNRDGVVSTEEEATYYNKHPDKASHGRAAESTGRGYTRQGVMAGGTGEGTGSCEVIA